MFTHLFFVSCPGGYYIGRVLHTNLTDTRNNLVNVYFTDAQHKTIIKIFAICGFSTRSLNQKCFRMLLFSTPPPPPRPNKKKTADLGHYGEVILKSWDG